METGMDKRAKMVACFDNQIEQMGFNSCGIKATGTQISRENHPSFNTAQEFKTQWYSYLEEGLNCGLLVRSWRERLNDAISLADYFILPSLLETSICCSPPGLQDYTVETGIAEVADGYATLKMNTQHSRDISFRIGSIYQRAQHSTSSKNHLKPII
ncbi:hypothetical protein NC652_030578 [Populus alba x Populus x berolinensis]|nr:hypothetical protein NC652_030578 [Populus alba x Populus x berolinensis]